MKNYNGSNHFPSLRNFTIKCKLGAVVSITLILIIINIFIEDVESYNSMELQQNSIINIETPEFIGINLSQIIKNNDGIFMVGSDLIPGTYKVELTDSTNLGYVIKYNSAAMGTDDIVAKHAFEENGYFLIKDSDLIVRLQGVKITLQQNFYLFGF